MQQEDRARRAGRPRSIREWLSVAVTSALTDLRHTAVARLQVDSMLKAANKRIESGGVDKELEQWEEALATYHRLQPEQDRAVSIRETVVPDLIAAYEARQADHDQARIEAERATEQLGTLKSELRELLSLRTVAVTITRAYKDSIALARDVSDLEATLAATGSMRTAKDVEVELAKLASDM